MITLAALVNRSDTSEVRARIRMVCAAEDLKGVRWHTNKDAGALFLDVLGTALGIIRSGDRVTIVAQFSDVVVPNGAAESVDDFSDEEWRWSWKAYLESHGVVFLAVDPGGLPLVSMSTRTSIIRSYQRATLALERVVDEARQAERRDAGEIGYFCGRPPYGYKVEAGRFVINQPQADAVRTVFRLTLEGVNGGDIITQLTGTPTKALHRRQRLKRVEYWDRKKIKRIIDHANLYCTGTYSSNKGEPVVIPALAFLPSSWLVKLRALQQKRLSQAPTVAINRPLRETKARAAEILRLSALARAAAVPSSADAGTMGANPPIGATP